MDNLIQQMKILQDKANRYDNIQKNNVEWAKRLKSVSEELTQLMAEMDPYSTVSTRERSNINFDEKVAEFYDKLIHGAEITSHLIKSTYPELNTLQVGYILRLMRERYPSTIKSRKEGVSVILYAGKEI